MQRFVSKLRGIGLLELMLSLAIIAILLVMATRYYGSTVKSQRVDDTIQLVGELETAVNTAISNDGTIYKDITIAKLVTSGYLSKARVTSDNKVKSPWGGSVTDTAETNDVKFVFAGVPALSCKDLSKKFYGDETTGCDATGTTDVGNFTYIIK